jgi:hypothetical protein
MSHLTCVPMALKVKNRKDTRGHLAVGLLSCDLQCLVKLKIYIFPDPIFQLRSMLKVYAHIKMHCGTVA